MNCERIEVTTTDGTAWLDRLTPRQMIAIGDRLYAQKKSRLIEAMKEAEIESAERMAMIAELENKRGLMSDAIKSDGAMEIISLASETPSAENASGLPDNFKGTSEQAMRIAIDLIGASVNEEEGKPSKKKK